MKKLAYYLDRAAEITGSDRQTALRVGVTPQYLSQARAKGTCSEDAALALSEVIGCNVLEVVAAISAEKSKSPELRKKWAELQRRAAGMAASLFGITVLISNAYQCILCKILPVPHHPKAPA